MSDYARKIATSDPMLDLLVNRECFLHCGAMAPKLDLDCYLFEGWKPRIRPSSRRRAWMDATPESFAYRCLPLAIANAHGWEIGNGGGFFARWLGGSGIDQIEIRLDGEADPIEAPASIFGQGVITFHIAGLFRTSPGWNLWVGGPPNHAKDGIAPLSGLIETDWSPYSFTMNWRFTRANHWVRFEPDEAIAFFFPIERGIIDEVQPQFRPITEAPDLERQFREWSRSRDAFQASVAANPPTRPADRWQKLYYRGVDPDGTPAPIGHQSKIQTRAFIPPIVDLRPAGDGCPVHRPPERDNGSAMRAARQLERQQALRALSPRLRLIPRTQNIGADAFLDAHYAANWPLILSGSLRIDRAASLPLLTHPSSADGAFIVMSAPPEWADARPDGASEWLGGGMGAQLRSGAAGAFAPLAEISANHLLMPIAGRVHILLLPPATAAALPRDRHDLLDGAPSPELSGRILFDLSLAPGDSLFVPVGWWMQMRAMDASRLLARSDFLWSND